MGRMTRRHFMQTAAAAVALAASPRARGANERVGIGIIGCRNRGHQDAASLVSTGQCDIVSLCDCDTAMIDRALDHLGEGLASTPKRASDFRSVLNDSDVDAVVIATPDHWHGLMTVMALDAGKHVYVEKPASYNIADGAMMAAAAERHGDLVVQVGTQQRSGQHFREAKQFINAGGLGRVGFARAWIAHERERLAAVPDSAPPETLDYEMWVGPAPMHPYNENRTHYNWHWVRDWGTGEMGNWGAHWLDVVRWLVDLGLPAEVSAHGGTFVTEDIKEWPDTQTVVFAYPETTVLWEQRLWTGYGVNRRRNGAELAGDKGTLIIDRGGWEFHGAEGRPERHGGSELNVAHASNFIGAIKGLARPAAPIAAGHHSAVLCHLGNIATVLGRPLDFDADREVIVGDDEAADWMDRPYRDGWQAERNRVV